MTKAELIKLYIEWQLGCDDTISQSYVISECIKAGFKYSEIEREGLKKFNKI